MAWYEVSIADLVKESSASTEELRVADAYDRKYGDFDYTNDLRSVAEKSFTEKFRQLLSGKEDILICGSNGGFEVSLLDGITLTALDISSVALDKTREKYPGVQAVQGSVNSLPFDDSSFEAYVAMRTFQSWGIDLRRAIKESIRVTRKGGRLVYSIPKGYLINGEIVDGMYVHKTGSFDEKLPLKMVEGIVTLLEGFQLEPEITQILSEIIVYTDIPE